jgi:hypothetical protein
MEYFKRVRQGKIRFRTDEKVSAREQFGVRRQYRSGFGLPRFLDILRIVEKAQVFRRRRIERSNSSDLETTVTDDLSAKLRAEIRETNPLAHWVVLNR